MFETTLITIGTMLLYSVPGYLMIKTKLCKKESISAFAIFLIYVCQPCLCMYAFKGVDFTKEFALRMIIFMGMMLLVLGIMLAGAYLIFIKKQDKAKYRIATISAGFGNFTFMGMPVIEALIPGNNEVKVFATIAFLSMSFLTWTVASAIITRDKKYCSIKKIFLNPGTISFIIALIFSIFKIELPGTIDSAVTLVGRMSTPICMIVLGMRLGTMKLTSLFTKPLVYAAIASKHIIMPFVGLAILLFLPVPNEMKLTFYIMCCMPIASNVLNFAEMLGDGMEEAANTVLLSAILSVATMPVMILLAPQL